jgi:DNA uptake protein ComE-like DNA-binding protein
MIFLGAILLIAIIVDLMAGHIKPGKRSDRRKWEQYLENADTSLGATGEIQKSLFAFDPNTIQEAMLDSLNIPQFLKNNLLRYRSKGGTFKKPEEIRKLYGMTDSLFAVIYPLVRIEESYIQAAKNRPTNIKKEQFTPSSDESFRKEKTDSGFNDYQKEVNVAVELNTADSATLTRLPGIGPVFAGRIVRFRKSLGGYSSVGQLLEVYGMREENFKRFKDNVTADTVQIKQIRINFADVYDLEHHPYISGSQAKRIVDHRSANGPFRSLSELEEKGIFDKPSLDRIKCYLTCR